jgi:hypothetical protein
MEMYALFDTRTQTRLGRYASYRAAVAVREQLLRLHPPAADWVEIRLEPGPGPLPTAA